MNATEYPHPVLQPGGLDYKGECKFEIAFNEEFQKIEEEDIALVVGYSLLCDSIKEMVQNERAEACIIVHSPIASYRRIYPIKPEETSVKIRINKFDVIDKIELYCVIVAASDNHNFKLVDFNPLFFENAVFNIKKGALLAKTEKITLYLDDTELEKPVASIFNINRRDEQEAHIQLDFTSDTGKIEINLCTKLYELYNNIERGYARTFRRCLTGAVVLPALVEAIDMLRTDYDTYSEYRWARVIEKKLERHGTSLQGDASGAELADMLLGNVIEGSLEAFIAVIEEKSEWEDSTGGVD